MAVFELCAHKTPLENMENPFIPGSLTYKIAQQIHLKCSLLQSTEAKAGLRKF